MASKSHFNDARYHGPIATRMRELMKDKNVSLAKMAEKLEKSKQAVSQYQNGTILPNLETLVKIADILDTTTDFLLGRTNDPKDQHSIIDDTGLSDRAVSVLKRLKESQTQNEIRLFNKIICNRNFPHALFYSDDYLAALQAEKIQEHFNKNIVSVAGEIDLITGVTDEEVLRLEKEEKEFDDVMTNVIESCVFGLRITKALQRVSAATKINGENVESIAAINAILYGGKILRELVDESLAEVDAKIKELE